MRSRISSGAITGCGEYTFGRWACGISQWRVIGMPAMRVSFLSHLLFPALEVHGAGERRQHHELREGDVGALRQRGGRVERLRAGPTAARR